MNEVNIMKILSNNSCPYIVHLVGVQLEKAPAMVVMELVNCGNFLEILRQSAFADVSQKKSKHVNQPFFIAIQIQLGVCFICSY